MGLQAVWYVAQWAFFVAGVHLFGVLLMESDWWRVPAEAQKRATERRKEKTEKPPAMIDNVYYTLEVAWYVPLILYAIASVCSVVSVILFVSESGVANDNYWSTAPAALISFVLLNLLLAQWIPWFYRKCQSRCTEQYLFMFGCFVCVCLLFIWFVLEDIIAGVFLIPLMLVVFVAFLFVLLAEYRCDNLGRPRTGFDCKLVVYTKDGRKVLL